MTHRATSQLGRSRCKNLLVAWVASVPGLVANPTWREHALYGILSEAADEHNLPDAMPIPARRDLGMRHSFSIPRPCQRGNIQPIPNLKGRLDRVLKPRKPGRKPKNQEK